jgi:hypothetical protein
VGAAVIRTALALIATAAHSQTAPRTLQEHLFGYPATATPTPITLFTGRFNPPPAPQAEEPPPPTRTVLRAEYGGRIDHHLYRFQQLAADGGEFEIRGVCESACTLVMGAIPKPRLCFGKNSHLAFHQARNADNTPAPTSTLWMIDHYPADIRAWINAKGGYREIPFHKYWYLPASELWAMGYRRCAD